jgi:hypothetical protein
MWETPSACTTAISSRYHGEATFSPRRFDHRLDAVALQQTVEGGAVQLRRPIQLAGLDDVDVADQLDTYRSRAHSERR